MVAGQQDYRSNKGENSGITTKVSKAPKVTKELKLAQVLKNIERVKIIDIAHEPSELSEEHNLNVRMKRKRDVCSLPIVGEGRLKGDVIDIKSHAGSDT